MQFWTSMAAVLLSCAMIASSSRAHEVRRAEPSAPVEASATVPLYDDLGNLTYPVTTPRPLAQRYFDQGLRLTYAFNHADPPPTMMTSCCILSSRSCCDLKGVRPALLRAA